MTGLERVEALILTLGRQGLQRMTRSSLTEIRSVAQTAHTSGLIRIERELEALATHVARYLDADPLFRLQDYAEALNRVWLWGRATRARVATGAALDVALLGEARRTYVDVPGPLVVHPVAAVGWVTETDFVGITVYLARGDELLQASVVRPVMAFGRDPRRLMFQPMSESLSISVLDLAHTSLTLHGAKRSVDGRLSIHRELVLDAAPEPGEAVLAPWRVEDWFGVLERIRVAEVTPWRGTGGVPVYVEPTGWGHWEIDDKRARARLALLDATGAMLWVTVRLAPEHNLLVDNLQALAHDDHLRPHGLFGRATVEDGELRFQPWSGVWRDPLTLRMRVERRVHQVHLSLESLNQVRPA